MQISFERLKKNKYIVTNDYGFYINLSREKLEKYIKNNKNKKFDKLKNNQFIDEYLDINMLCDIISERFFLNYTGPQDHIISITRKCNLACKYCSINRPQNKDMSIITAKKIVDFIFSIKKEHYYIEITGGEPFKNFKILKFLVEYTQKKSIKENKTIHFSIVSNLIYLNDNLIDFIKKHKITVCTSIDAVNKIHNALRGNYLKTVSNLSKLLKLHRNGYIEQPNVITTITKDLLNKEDDIINFYLRLNINRIQLGVLEKMGRAIERWNMIGYSLDDYFKFYQRAIKKIIDININKNIPLYEKGLFLLIYPIITKRNFRARSIDIIHRFAYDVDGNIYPSDEGRILGENKDTFFKIGNVYNNSFKDVIINNKSKAIFLYYLNYLTQPYCSRCPYAFFCVIHPYFNYITQKNIYGNMVTNERCALFKKIFNMIFNMIENKKIANVFRKWVELYG